MDYDVETQMQFSDESIRRGFIRKVYGILFAQILVTVGVVTVFTFSTSLQHYSQKNSWLIIVALVVNFALLIALSCCTNVRRNFPMNLICLALFTATESLLLGVVAGRYESKEVMIALGTCAAIVFALSVFSFQSKIDFTRCGGALCAVFTIFIIFAIISAIFMRSRLIEMGIAAFGACLFSLYIIYDTQIMMGGKHRYAISPEEYIYAALNLYLDVVNLFLYLLRFIGLARN